LNVAPVAPGGPMTSPRVSAELRDLRVAALQAAIDAATAQDVAESVTRRARTSRATVVSLCPVLTARASAARLSDRHRALFAALPVDDRNALLGASLSDLQFTLSHLPRGSR
jgi:hypothetical protein